jgi:hypothetical protein
MLSGGYPGTRVLLAQYGAIERCPAFQLNWDANIVLGWAMYNDTDFFTSANDATATRDFNGSVVPEQSPYTVLMIKRQRAVGAGSEVAVVLTSPNGVKYRTNWYLSGDPYNRNQLIVDQDGSIPPDYVSYISISFGAIHVADQLSYEEAEEIWRVGDFDAYQERVRVVPDSSSNPTVGAYAAPVELSIPNELSMGWVARYTTDGTDPRSSNTPAGFDLPTNLTYGSELYISAIVLGGTSFTTRRNVDMTLNPTVYMSSLFTNVVAKIFLAPTGVTGYVSLVAHGSDVYAVYSNGGLYKLPINGPGTSIQVGRSASF